MIQWWTIWASACCLIVAKANDCSYIEEIGDMYCKDVSIGVLRRETYPLNITNANRLRRLNLVSANLTSVERDAFQNITNLVYLEMNDNKIEKLDNNLFKTTPELRQLFVARNRIEHLSIQLFKSIPNLTHLDISSNPLSNFANTQILSPLKGLLYLSINNLNLKKIPIDVFEQLTSLLQVNLYDNGIQCRCSLWNSTVWAKGKCVSLSLNCKGINSVSYWNLESYYENRCGPNRKLKKRRKYIFNHPAFYTPSYPGYRYHKRRNHHDFSSPYDYPDFDTKPMYIDEDYIYDDTDTNETLSLDVSKSYCQRRECRFSTYLDRMDCEGNNIEIFQSNSYPFPERMFTELVLDDNKLKTLEANPFDQLRELMIISLRKNLLSNLDPDVFKSLKNLII
ncbi:hypothetical protein L9F63_028242, partial [Diploptera punctata]